MTDTATVIIRLRARVDELEAALVVVRRLGMSVERRNDTGVVWAVSNTRAQAAEAALTKLRVALGGCANIIEARCADCMRGKPRQSRLDGAWHPSAQCKMTDAEDTMLQIARAALAATEVSE